VDDDEEGEDDKDEGDEEESLGVLVCQGKKSEWTSLNISKGF